MVAIITKYFLYTPKFTFNSWLMKQQNWDKYNTQQSTQLVIELKFLLQTLQRTNDDTNIYVIVKLISTFDLAYIVNGLTRAKTSYRNKHWQKIFLNLTSFHSI